MSPPVLRSARPEDAFALHELHASAFTRFQVFGPPWSADAPSLQTLLCARREYEPALSRVLVEPGASGDWLLGHALWNAFTIRVDGEPFRMLNLAPLSVRAERQAQGLGALLMRDGIALAREMGFEIMTIVGHDAYYPRFGLLTRCLGRVGLVVPRAQNEPLPQGWALRPVAADDEPLLGALWERVHAGDRSCLLPDPGLQSWMSRVRGIASCVLEGPSGLGGYARVDLRPAAQDPIKAFLACDPFAARWLLSTLLEWIGTTAVDPVFLPLCAESAFTRELFPQANPVHEAWEPGMAMAIPAPEGASSERQAKEGRIEAVLHEIRAGLRPPLALCWPPFFDE